jgi:hypothetical protein
MANGQGMHSRTQLYRLTIPFLALLGISGCTHEDSSPSAPELPRSIRGFVVDADGNAVADAGIAISLWPSVPQAVKTGDAACRAAPKPTDASVEAIWITDYCDAIVRYLCEGDCPQEGIMTWDGRNDQGLQVVDGVYHVNVRPGDTPRIQDLLLVGDYEQAWTYATHEFSAHTGADGSFEIAQDCLPFGHEFDIINADGNITDTRGVSRWVHVISVDPANRSARQDSVFVDEQVGAEVMIWYPR